MPKTFFEWDEDKDKQNQKKHGISFALAQHAFLDPHRVIVEDITQRGGEERFYCVGSVEGGIMTVRFTYRGNVMPNDDRGSVRQSFDTVRHTSRSPF